MMGLNLFRLFGGRTRSAPVRRRSNPSNAFRYRPTLEGCEERVVMSAMAIAPPGLAAAGGRTVAQRLPAGSNITIPVAVNGITVQNTLDQAGNLVGNLLANVTVAGQNLQIPILASLTPDPADAGCQILHLEIQSLHLNLLGLTVDTSPICLDISAVPGQGQLLGNLLCPNDGTASLLTSVTDLLNQLTGPTAVTGLVGELQQVINQSLTKLISSASLQNTSVQPGNILHLELGPVDLNVLGLNVHVDNCADGPVTVDVGARAGHGNLLGNLLNGLTHLLDSHASQVAIGNKLGKIGNTISHLLGSTL